jgi:hypothetical protein
VAFGQARQAKALPARKPATDRVALDAKGGHHLVDAEAPMVG